MSFSKTVWFPEMLAYAQLIRDPNLLLNAWVKGDRTQAWVADFDELYKGMFDWTLYPDGPTAEELGVDAECLRLLNDFLTSFRDFCGIQEDRPDLASGAGILKAPEWNEVKAVADHFCVYALSKGYSSERQAFDELD